MNYADDKVKQMPTVLEAPLEPSAQVSLNCATLEIGGTLKRVEKTQV